MDKGPNGFELTYPIETGFTHHHCPGAAAEKMPVPERMEGMRSTVIGSNPADHGRESKVSDSHRMLLMRFRKDFLSFLDCEQVEELARSHDIGVDVDLLALKQREGFGNKGIGHTGALENDCP